MKKVSASFAALLTRLLVLTAALFVVSASQPGQAGAQNLGAAPRPCIQNGSTPTLCAEEDNVLVRVMGRRVAGADVIIRATNPVYMGSLPASAFQCDPDWRNCPVGPPGGAPDDCSTKLFDDGVNVILLCRVDRWWRGADMAVSVRGGGSGRGHYLAWARRLGRQPFWPQAAILYQDSNLRLKPFTNVDPDANDDGIMDRDNCFSSSVIIGPAPASTHPRPYADIQTVEINPRTMCLNITYAGGLGTARLCLSVSTRAATATLNANYPTNLVDAPIVTFRSMYVDSVVNDAALVRVGSRTYPLLGDWEKLNGRNFLFQRLTPGTHNPTGPDIRITTAPF